MIGWLITYLNISELTLTSPLQPKIKIFSNHFSVSSVYCSVILIILNSTQATPMSKTEQQSLRASSYFLWFGLLGLVPIHFPERRLSMKLRGCSLEIFVSKNMRNVSWRSPNGIHCMTITIHQKRMLRLDQRTNGFCGQILSILTKRLARRRYLKKSSLKPTILSAINICSRYTSSMKSPFSSADPQGQASRSTLRITSLMSSLQINICLLNLVFQHKLPP